MSFAPSDSQDSRSHRMQLAKAANEALRGETHNTGSIPIPKGATEFEILDSRIGYGKVLVLSPRTSGAAGLQWYVRDLEKERAVIAFTSPSEHDAVFDYVIVGVIGKQQ